MLTIIDHATPALQALAARVRDRRALAARLASVALEAVRRHFALREQEPNKRGWPKQHFWAGVRRATTISRIDDTGATVSVSDPAFAHKVTGGTIRPRAGRKFLAIPLRAEAAGKLPRSGLIPELFFMKTRSGRGLLVTPGRAGRGGARESVRPYYLLLPSVTHRPDPRALPNLDALADSLLETARRRIAGN
jgi:phage gpG-like protein